MKKCLLILIAFFFIPICLSQNFDAWAERGGPFTIGKPEKILIYVKNNGLSSDSYFVETIEIKAFYNTHDVSNLLVVDMPSNSIKDVAPNETKLTQGRMIILGPVTSGRIKLRIVNSASQYKEVELRDIRAAYPQSLPEFNSMYTFFILISACIILLKSRTKMLLALLLIPLVEASYISITTDIQAPVIYENVTSLQTTLTNSGDEVANDVIVTIMSKHFYSDDIYFGSLAPNKPIKKSANLYLRTGLKEGRYICMALTKYKDLNGHPFSAVSPIEVIYKTSTISKISLIAKNIKMEENGKGKIEIKVKNNDINQYKINLTLYLPEEINTNKNQIELLMLPGSEKNIIFEVSNFNALKGSNYVYFAAIDYEDTRHYSEYSIGYIEIVEKSKIKPSYILVFLVLLTSLILFFYSKRK
ncbi:MAG: hypothetical protein QXO84_00205 [Candidatus Aenigmatarchaeota archaeon]